MIAGKSAERADLRRESAPCRSEVVEAAGVEPASENVTGQENYMRSPVHALGITRGRSRPALRTDKKRVPLACDLNLPTQT